MESVALLEGLCGVNGRLLEALLLTVFLLLGPLFQFLTAVGIKRLGKMDSTKPFSRLFLRALIHLKRFGTVLDQSVLRRPVHCVVVEGQFGDLVCNLSLHQLVGYAVERVIALP